METKRRPATPDRDMAAWPLPEALDSALDRLAAAMERLRAAGQRQADAMMAGPAAGDGGLAFLHPGDVGSLTEERDAALAREEALRQANDAALLRLDRVETSIDTVLRELTARTAQEPSSDEPSSEEPSSEDSP